MNDKGSRKRPASLDFANDHESSSLTGNDSGRQDNDAVGAPNVASAASLASPVEHAESSKEGDAKEKAENAKQSGTARENALAKERKRSQMRRKKSKEYHDRLQREVFSLSRRNTELKKDNDELERLIKTAKDALQQNEFRALQEIQQKLEAAGSLRESALTMLSASSTTTVASIPRASKNTDTSSAQSNNREVASVHDSQNPLVRQLLLEELARRRSQVSRPAGQLLIANRFQNDASFLPQNEVNNPNIRSLNRFSVHGIDNSGLSILINDTLRENAPYARQATSNNQYRAAISQLLLSQHQSMQNAAQSHSSRTARLENNDIISMLTRSGSREGTLARLRNYDSATPNVNLNDAIQIGSDARFHQENENVLRSNIESLLQQQRQQRDNAFINMNMTKRNQIPSIGYALDPNRQYTAPNSFENETIRAVLTSLTASRSGQLNQFQSNRRMDEYARDLLQYRRRTLPFSQSAGGGGAGLDQYESTLTQRGNSAPPFPGLGGNSQASNNNVAVSGGIEEKCDESTFTAQYIELLRRTSDQNNRFSQGPSEQDREPSGGRSRAA